MVILIIRVDMIIDLILVRKILKMEMMMRIFRVFLLEKDWLRMMSGLLEGLKR